MQSERSAGGARLAQATDVFRLEGFGAVSRGMGGTAAARLAAAASPSATMRAASVRR